MGPILLPDKSAIQALSTAELNFLRRYYTLNVAPILLLEILGDLKKETADNNPKRWVVILARKLAGASAVNMHYRDLLKVSLLGQKVIMRGVPILQSGRPVIGPEGKPGLIIEESVEELALLRWRNGDFLKAEEGLAERWRTGTRAIDLEHLQRLLKTTHRDLPAFSSVAALKDFVEQFIAGTDPGILLEWFLNEIPFDLLTRIRGFANFTVSKAETIKGFSPYVHYCLVVSLIFRFGLARGLVSTRATNWVDMDYLYYIPFCSVFTSRDRLHIDLISPLLTQEQIFIHGDQLKADLSKMAAWWEAMADDERQEYDASGGVGPPEWPDSVTFQVWQKQMSPNYRRRGPRNLLDTLAPEVLEKVVKHVVTRLEQSTPSSTPVSSDDPNVDFVAKKKSIRYDDPCICGSERIFGECCGKNLKFQP